MKSTISSPRKFQPWCNTFPRLEALVNTKALSGRHVSTVTLADMEKIILRHSKGEAYAMLVWNKGDKTDLGFMTSWTLNKCVDDEGYIFEAEEAGDKHAFVPVPLGVKVELEN